MHFCFAAEAAATVHIGHKKRLRHLKYCISNTRAAPFGQTKRGTKACSFSSQGKTKCTMQIILNVYATSVVQRISTQPS
jgi:hypothetical protein